MPYAAKQSRHSSGAPRPAPWPPGQLRMSTTGASRYNAATRSGYSAAYRSAYRPPRLKPNNTGFGASSYFAVSQARNASICPAAYGQP